MECCNTIIDKKFIHLDKELEKVVGLFGEKIEAKFGEFSNRYIEVEIEEACQEALKGKVASLEERLEHTLAHVANLPALLLSVQGQVGDLEDLIMEESNNDDEGDMMESSSSSSTDVEPVENMVAIPAPGPRLSIPLSQLSFLWSIFLHLFVLLLLLPAFRPEKMIYHMMEC